MVVDTRLQEAVGWAGVSDLAGFRTHSRLLAALFIFLEFEVPLPGGRPARTKTTHLPLLFFPFYLYTILIHFPPFSFFVTVTFICSPGSSVSLTWK